MKTNFKILKSIIVFSLAMLAMPTFAQDNQKNNQVIQTNDSIVENTDKMPEFPGGMAECMKFLSKNIKYPKEAQKNGEQGRVVLQFVVDRDGSITDVEVARSVSPSIDKEAIRVIKKMPKWTPGTLHEKPVRVRYTLPIMFRLNGNAKYDVAADFPGGIRNLELYLKNNIEYPEDMKERGLVMVSFDVDEMGDILNVKVKQSLCYEADIEAVRVVQMMPRWKPATKNGKPVRMTRTISVPFYRR